MGFSFSYKLYFEVVNPDLVLLFDCRLVHEEEREQREKKGCRRIELVFMK